MNAQKKTRLGVESLERRAVPSVKMVHMYEDPASTYLDIVADDRGSDVEVHQSGSDIVVVDRETGRSWSFQIPDGVLYLGFYGGEGNDRFVSHVSSLRTQAYGWGGDDHLAIYDGSDY